MKSSALIMLAALACCVAAAPAQNRTQSHLFQQAIDWVETKGDYPAAIRLFEEVARGPDRHLAASALLQAGLGYEKLGKDDAQAAYRRVIREFPEQHEAVGQARARLSKLVPTGPSNLRSALTTRQVWAGPEVDVTGSVSRDGRYLSFTDWEAGGVALRDLATGQKRLLTRNEHNSYAENSRLSPGGEQIVYVGLNQDGGYELRVVRTDGSPPRLLYRNEETPYLWPADWSPDGKQIVAGLGRKDRTIQIALITVADGSARVLKTLADWSSPGRITLSPDGRYVAYDGRQQEKSSERDIFALATDGSREVPLIEHPSDDMFPVWGPDSRHLLFISDRRGPLSIWMSRVVDGKPQGDPELIKPETGSARPLGLTRQGSYYYSVRTSTNDVYLAELDSAAGKILRPATPVSERQIGSKGSPDWSADGRFLAHRGPGPLSISILSLETGQSRSLSPPLQFLNRPRWSPDGRSLLVIGSDRSSRVGLYKIDTTTGEAAPILYSDLEWECRAWRPGPPMESRSSTAM